MGQPLLLGKTKKTSSGIDPPLVYTAPRGALVAPADHPLASKRRDRIKLEEIGRYGLILPPRHLATWRMVEAVFQQHGVAYNVTLEAGGWEVIKKYVEMGLGISIVTDICLTGNEKLVRIPLDRFFAHRTYGVVLRRKKHLLAPARKFIEMMAPPPPANWT